MTITIVDGNGKKIEIELEKYIAYYRQTVWIGGRDERVYNVITVEGYETYQCTVAYDKATDKWLLTNGQVRTECPKGLLSDRSKACTMCRGCCVNAQTANPTYSLREPQKNTKVNGKPVPESGIELIGGEEISIK